MKYFIPYHNEDSRSKTSIKEQVDNFVQRLIKLCFPPENIKISESGIEIETVNTVLHVGNGLSGSSLTEKTLFYGNIALIKKVEKSAYWDKYCSVTFCEINDNDLPHTLQLSTKEIDEAQALADEIALQEKDKISKHRDISTGTIWYDESVVKTHLKPIIRGALVKKGYSGNALESKFNKILVNVCQKFDDFARQETLNSLPPFSKALRLLNENAPNAANSPIQSLVNVLNRLDHGAANLNPYWMGSSRKRDKIALEVIKAMNSEGINGVIRSLTNEESSLYQAINQRRITPLTLFGKNIKVSFTESHSAQIIKKNDGGMP